MSNRGQNLLRTWKYQAWTAERRLDEMIAHRNEWRDLYYELFIATDGMCKDGCPVCFVDKKAPARRLDWEMEMDDD